MGLFRRVCIAVFLWALLFTSRPAPALGPDGVESSDKGPTFEVSTGPERSSALDSVGAVVVHPFRSASVGTEIAGVVEKVLFDEGDEVREGDVVAEISPKRYEIAVSESEERIKTLELVKKRAEAELALKKSVLAREAGTQQEVLRAEAELDVARAKIIEAQRRLDLDKLNLDACRIKAPFTGRLAVRYKQPFETVDRLEKVFLLVDTAQLYAVANVPEHLLPRFTIGRPAVFEHSTGTRHKGVVAKLGILVDPKSGAAKVHVKMDNASGALRIGTTGRLEIPK
jgi:multidrug efflux system membrane fusion protein